MPGIRILAKVTLTGLRRIINERKALCDASLVLKRHGYDIAARDAEFLANLYTTEIRNGYRELHRRREVANAQENEKRDATG